MHSVVAPKPFVSSVGVCVDFIDVQNEKVSEDILHLLGVVKNTMDLPAGGGL